MPSELLLRTVSALVLGSAVLFLTWLGGVGFRLLAVVMTAMLFFEWYRIVASRGLSPFAWLGGGATIAGVCLSILASTLTIGLIVCVAGAALVAGVRIVERADTAPAVGILYSGLFGVALVAIRESEPYGGSAVFFLLTIIWTTDILAYFGGRYFGGPKLAPAISPNKTWSGFFSGMLGGIICGSIAAWLLGSQSQFWIMFLAGFLSVSGQIGDLFESGFKRRFDFKDSSHVIPGHGGVMDRLDSLIFATLAAYIVSTITVTLSNTGSFNGLSAAILMP